MCHIYVHIIHVKNCSSKWTKTAFVRYVSLEEFKITFVQIGGQIVNICVIHLNICVLSASHNELRFQIILRRISAEFNVDVLLCVVAQEQMWLPNMEAELKVICVNYRILSTSDKHDVTTVIEHVSFICPRMFLVGFAWLMIASLFKHEFPRGTALMMTSWNGTFSALQAFCAANSPITGEFSSQRPMTRSFDVFLICTLINASVNDRDAGDLRRHGAHNDVTVMSCATLKSTESQSGSLKLFPLLQVLNVILHFPCTCKFYFGNMYFRKGEKIKKIGTSDFSFRARHVFFFLFVWFFFQ